MNSELIDKAFLKSDLVSCIDYDVLNYKECLNKFAELIVNECLNELCEQMDKHHIDLSNLPSWYKALAQTEKHFGVEE